MIAKCFIIWFGKVPPMDKVQSERPQVYVRKLWSDWVDCQGRVSIEYIICLITCRLVTFHDHKYLVQVNLHGVDPKC